MINLCGSGDHLRWTIELYDDVVIMAHEYVHEIHVRK